MNNELTEEQIKDILQAFDESLASGPWDKSNFLRVIGKNLKEIRDKFASQAYSEDPAKLKMQATLANRVAMRAGFQEIYVSLYSTNGGNMAAWEKIIYNLPKQMISRPIYAHEEDVRAAIRHKENRINEAYVAIYVNQSSLLSLAADKLPTDKLGKPLLTLKDRAIDLHNIVRFVHLTGIYEWRDNRLVKTA